MVVRYNHTTKELSNARPCHKCLKMLQEVGFNKIYYSMNNTIYIEKINDMISINCSSYARKMDHIYYNMPLNIIDYYINIVSKLPKTVKKQNAEYFIKSFIDEVNGCRYIYQNHKTKLELYINNILLGSLDII
jgi:hypothetical protein